LEVIFDGKPEAAGDIASDAANYKANLANSYPCKSADLALDLGQRLSHLSKCFSVDKDWVESRDFHGISRTEGPIQLTWMPVNHPELGKSSIH
jgi:hypothetical protein